MSIEKVLEKTDNGTVSLTREDILSLLQASSAEKKLLYERADDIRYRRLGDDVHLRGIIEFSNHCYSNCLYCGLRAENRAVSRYRMDPGEILSAARTAAGMGLKTVVLQSGQDPYYTKETLVDIISAIKGELDVAVTLSLGIRPESELVAFREAGADRYLLKHETADPDLFAALRPGTGLGERIGCLRALKDMGYQVGSGNIIGLPGQTADTLARDLLLLRELDVEMAGIGPFVPNPDTPLGSYPRGGLEATLTAIAVARLLLPQAHIPATTALGTMHPHGRRLALQCGANVVMPNVTPRKYRPHYSIYPNKLGYDKDPQISVDEIRSFVLDMGRVPGSGYGHSPRWSGPPYGRGEGNRFGLQSGE
ncbi:MAG: [FeFe] hydrogenase H-cluster radical SAM maturase HydE [Bacillota bacterium]